MTPRWSGISCREAKSRFASIVASTSETFMETMTSSKSEIVESRELTLGGLDDRGSPVLPPSETSGREPAFTPMRIGTPCPGLRRDLGDLPGRPDVSGIDADLGIGKVEAAEGYTPVEVDVGHEWHGLAAAGRREPRRLPCPARRTSVCRSPSSIAFGCAPRAASKPGLPGIGSGSFHMVCTETGQSPPTMTCPIFTAWISLIRR